MPPSPTPDRPGDGALIPFAQSSIIARGLALASEVATGPRKIRIMVVDDIIETRFNLAKLISFETDMEVVAHAGDGREALRVAWDEQPDVILMDIYMPAMDGITATEHLSAVWESPPVIMMSVQGDQDYLRRAMLAGAKEYLVKPFSADELVAAIRHVYDLAQLRTSTQEGDPELRRSTVGRTIPIPDTVSEAAPCDLLPTEAEMPVGFKVWAGAGPMGDYHAPTSRYCNRIFTSGSRPSTVSPVVWTEVSVSTSTATAVQTFNRLVDGVHEQWGYGAPSANVGRQQPEPWPNASEFSPVTELEVDIGQQSRAFEAVMFGRHAVWVYARLGGIVCGVRAQDVDPVTVIALAAQIAETAETKPILLANLCGDHKARLSDSLWCVEGEHQVATANVVQAYEYEPGSYVVLYEPHLSRLRLDGNQVSAESRPVLLRIVEAIFNGED